MLNDNEVIDTVAAYMKKGRTWRPLRLVADLVQPNCPALTERLLQVFSLDKVFYDISVPQQEL